MHAPRPARGRARRKRRGSGRQPRSAPWPRAQLAAAAPSPRPRRRRWSLQRPPGRHARLHARQTDPPTRRRQNKTRRRRQSRACPGRPPGSDSGPTARPPRRYRPAPTIGRASLSPSGGRRIPAEGGASCGARIPAGGAGGAGRRRRWTRPGTSASGTCAWARPRRPLAPRQAAPRYRGGSGPQRAGRSYVRPFRRGARPPSGPPAAGYLWRFPPTLAEAAGRTLARARRGVRTRRGLRWQAGLRYANPPRYAARAALFRRRIGAPVHWRRRRPMRYSAA
mmetsp:Transcript_10005/g.33069  ORF Transcript_10005/g.33069 Transcript_10005/m.33069 type:complete len:280 (-) Transcript_10005:84-923(-)